MQTQCLAQAQADAGLGAHVEVRVRFLHVIQRSVARLTATGREPVDELVVGAERYVPWEEATEREVVTELRPAHASGSRSAFRPARNTRSCTTRRVSPSA